MEFGQRRSHNPPTQKISIERLQSAFGLMAETRGESDVTSAGIPEHRGTLADDQAAMYSEEHNTSSGNSKANNGKAVDVGQEPECVTTGL
jgi:hypothetical protein